MHFYCFSGGVWGAKPPRKFLGIFRLFFNIFVLVKLFFAFFRGVRGRSPRKFFEIFQFFDAGGGLPRIFSWLFSDFLMSEKNRGGGVRRKMFSWRHFFTAPYISGKVKKVEILRKKKRSSKWGWNILTKPHVLSWNFVFNVAKFRVSNFWWSYKKIGRFTRSR